MELSVTKLFKKNLVDIKKIKMINFGKDPTTDIDGKLSLGELFKTQQIQ
jgi:hypothetical protein